MWVREGLISSSYFETKAAFGVSPPFVKIFLRFHLVCMDTLFTTILCGVYTGLHRPNHSLPNLGWMESLVGAR